MNDRPTELTLLLQASPTYVSGLPMFVEVTLTNETEAAEYYALGPCDPWSPPFPVEFTLRADGQEIRLPARSDISGGPTPRGFDLVPGQARTFVLDLSELETPLPLGLRQLDARWVMRHERPRSASVPITIASVEATDAPLLHSLRRVGGGRNSSWANLVKDPSALDQSTLRDLSPDGRRALVPYLIIHQAIHGPEPLARFPIQFFRDQEHGPWASEAAVLGYELAWARRADDLSEQRAALLVTWPGVAFRLDQIDRGLGLLATWREQFGGGGSKP